jgi:uncharacterized protein (TIGR03084 family)
MADDVRSLLEDLDDEHAALDAVVEPLDDDGWDVPTPSPGWRVRDQVGHLAYFDDRGRLSATDPDAFTAERDAALADLAGFEAAASRLGREETGAALLDTWREARRRCVDALVAVPDGARLPWYGPPMSVRSFATARLMETWAHGQDVVDGLVTPGRHAERPATDRLRHICHIGFSTRGWSYAVRGAEAPTTAVRVALTLPSGATWTAGVEAATESVTGPAEDFCLVVTQRRNVADTALAVDGEAAAGWMAIAQCFAGAPTMPPEPGSRTAPTAR